MRFKLDFKRLRAVHLDSSYSYNKIKYIFFHDFKY